MPNHELPSNCPLVNHLRVIALAMALHRHIADDPEPREPAAILKEAEAYFLFLSKGDVP